jgi:hypothetical protein
MYSTLKYVMYCRISAHNTSRRESRKGQGLKGFKIRRLKGQRKGLRGLRRKNPKAKERA